MRRVQLPGLGSIPVTALAAFLLALTATMGALVAGLSAPNPASRPPEASIEPDPDPCTDDPAALAVLDELLENEALLTLRDYSCPAVSSACELDDLGRGPRYVAHCTNGNRVRITFLVPRGSGIEVEVGKGAP